MSGLSDVDYILDGATRGDLEGVCHLVEVKGENMDLRDERRGCTAGHVILGNLSVVDLMKGILTYSRGLV